MSIAPPYLWPGEAAAVTSSKRPRSDIDESRKRSRFFHSHSTSNVSRGLQSSAFLQYGPRATTLDYSSRPSVDYISRPFMDYNSRHASQIAPPVSYPIQWTGPTETTASGLSISCDSSLLRDDVSIDSGTPSSSSSSSSGRSSCSDPPASGHLTDAQAAQVVREHLTLAHRNKPNSQHARILRTLVSPRTRAADFTLDDAALASIFSSANELFFAGRLQGRVAWDWSHGGAPQYRQHVIGTTAVRKRSAAAGGGLDTLIILSRPILRDGGFNRRLLISTFLHEMIHCFLFVCCGMAAIRDGGHTQGFRDIARMIDVWAGQETLHLCEMEADLERFRDSPRLVGEAGNGSSTAATGSGMQYYYQARYDQQQQQPRRSNPVIDTRRQAFDYHRHYADSCISSPSTSRECLQPVATRPAVHEHTHGRHVHTAAHTTTTTAAHAHLAPPHRRYYAHANRPSIPATAAPLDYPRHPYHPVTCDHWDSPLFAPLSSSPSPSPSPNSSTVFDRRYSISSRYKGDF